MFYAPEMFSLEDETEIRGEKCDIWALGITLFYMLTGQYPYEEAVTVMDLGELIRNKQIDFSLIKHEQARDLVKGLLNHDQNKRLTISEIVESPWVTKNETNPINLNKYQV